MFRCLSITSVFWTVGCCPPISPQPQAVQLWVEKELPAGSSVDDVKGFCQRHGFIYVEQGAYQGTYYAEAYRRVGGCEATESMVLLNVRYGEDLRVKQINVKGLSMLP